MYSNKTVLRNNLLNAMWDVEAYQLAYHKAADTVQKVISDLHASFATLKRPITHLIPLEPPANFVDSQFSRGNGSKQPAPRHSKKMYCLQTLRMLVYKPCRKGTASGIG